MRTGVSATIEQAIGFYTNQVLNVVVRQAGIAFTERCSGGVEQLGIVNAGVLWGGVGAIGIGGHICAFHWLRGLLFRAFAASTITATAICTVGHVVLSESLATLSRRISLASVRAAISAKCGRLGGCSINWIMRNPMSFECGVSHLKFAAAGHA